ncbi:hypothetical protein [Fibrobacter sp. UWB12]|uniref:hypothetical protein n=1 Tax=Fibrobacter sp. UWB12 TaxID=1896203 RepID=UPI0009115648|nr:hypothetical protein [Fibrobacter sp. UWB12]SHK96141.1 Endonuclease/Exonuclease/phosphatase family protein [Fibrobacter sp. UWB12]
MKITIVSYNISKSLYLQQAVEKYLNSKNDRIVFLQEVPKNFSIGSGSPNIFVPQISGTPNGTVVMFSKNITKFFTKAEYRKGFLVVRTKYGTFANVHMPNMYMRNSPDEIDRAKIEYAQIVKKVKSLRNLKIVGGDFNLNVFDSCMGSAGECMWTAKRSVKEKPRDYDIFINPFWSVMYLKKNETPVGTTEDTHHTSVVSKVVYDQFLIKPDMVNDIYSYGIIDRLGRTSIKQLSGWARLAKKNSPINGVYYDFDGSYHFPVYITLKF